MKRKICHILFLGASLLFIIRCKSDFIDVSCDSPVILTSLEDNKITYDFSYSDLSLNKVKTTYINAYDEKFYLYSNDIINQINYKGFYIPSSEPYSAWQEITKISNGYRIDYNDQTNTYQHTYTTLTVTAKEDQMTERAEIIKLSDSTHSKTRFVYNDLGNIVKIFHKSSPQEKEYIIYEISYDSHPNPMANQKWFWRFNYNVIPYGENQNNPIIIKRYDFNATTCETMIISYVYDSKTSLPLSSTWTTDFNSTSQWFLKKMIFNYTNTCKKPAAIQL
jgi:hypothetical protein